MRMQWLAVTVSLGTLSQHTVRVITISWRLESEIYMIFSLLESSE